MLLRTSDTGPLFSRCPSAVSYTHLGSQLEAFINYTSAGKSVTLFVPLSYVYTQASNGFDTYIATQAVRLYADPGTSISLTAYSPTGSTGTLFLTVSGYRSET